MSDEPDSFHHLGSDTLQHEAKKELAMAFEGKRASE